MRIARDFIRAHFLLFVVVLLLPAVGCYHKMPVAPPPPAVDTIMGANDARLEESLFKGDQAVLSNQEISRILGAHLTFSDRHQMAILGISSWGAWLQEIADLETQNSERFLQTLKTAPQLTEVRFMPSLLVPEKRTVPYLREAAARFQADLLLVYSVRMQTFQKDRFLGTNEVRAQCIVESVLLDVRTGIVAHSARAAEAVNAKKSAGDINFSETIAKAETDAAGKALVKVADSVVTFLRDASK